MKTTKQHFLFDLDDTLTDSYQFNQQTFVDVFAPYLDLSNSDAEQYLRELHFSSRGKSMIWQFEEAVAHFSLNVNPDDLLKADEQLQLANAHNMPIFDAVEDVIKVLKKKGRQVSLLSNRQYSSLNKILTTHHLEDYLTYAISCSDEGHEKPDPHCLNKLITESGQPKENFIYFGDSKTDHDFAMAAGIDFVIIDHYLNQKKFYKLLVESFM